MRNSLKICFPIFTYQGMGTYGRSSKLGRALSSIGHDVTILCSSNNFSKKPKIYSKYNIKHVEFYSPLHYLPLFGSGNSIYDIYQRMSFLKKNKFDVIHGFEHFFNVDIPITYARKKYNFVYLSDWCDLYSAGIQYNRSKIIPYGQKIIEYLETRARIQADGITVISPYLENLAKNIKSSENVYLLPNGCPYGWFNSIDKKEAKIRSNFHLDDKIIGLIGNVNKNALLIFSKALKKIIKSNVSVKILITGKHGEKRYKPILSSCGIADKNIITTGFVSDKELHTYMSSCDLFINPLIDSVYDLARGPEKAGAYFAIGRPVIISDIGNLDAKIVDKFKLGYSVDNSTNDIYDKIQSLFLDKDLAISFEENCKKYARNNSWIKIAKKLEKIYFNLLQKSS